MIFVEQPLTWDIVKGLSPVVLASRALDETLPANERRKAWQGLHAAWPDTQWPMEAELVPMVKRALALDFPPVIDQEFDGMWLTVG